MGVRPNQLAKWRDEIGKKLLLEPKNRDYDIEIVMPDGAVLPQRGKINFSDPSFSQDTGSFLVRAVLPNPKREATHCRAWYSAMTFGAPITVVPSKMSGAS